MNMTITTRFAATAMAALLTAGAAQAEGVKVELISTLSGGGAGLGTDVRDGFLLAIERSGRDDIEVVVEDDQRKPDVAVRAAERMIQSEEVDVLTGLIFSNLAMAVIPSAVNQGVIYMSPNAGPSALAGAGCHENYFNVAWQNDVIHEGMGAHANDLGYSNSFILAPNYPAGIDALNGYKRTYEGEVAQEVMTRLGQTDYAAEIAQIRASGADSVYFFLPGGMGISFLKQYADSGVDVPLIGPAFSFDQTILPAVGDAALGVRNTSQWSPDLDNEANMEFVAAFQEEYGRIPSMYASQGYDTGLLLVSAMEKADPSDMDAFRAAILEADFASTRGDFAFHTNQHPIQDVYVREVVMNEDGVFTNELIGLALEDHVDSFAGECGLNRG
jgi:branched-chain amino acid transport system substrate-binding protein